MKDSAAVWICQRMSLRNSCSPQSIPMAVEASILEWASRSSSRSSSSHHTWRQVSTDSHILKEFAVGLAAMSQRVDFQDTIRLAFEALDIDGNGRIDLWEMKSVLKRYFSNMEDQVGWYSFHSSLTEWQQVEHLFLQMASKEEPHIIKRGELSCVYHLHDHHRHHRNLDSDDCSTIRGLRCRESRIRSIGGQRCNQEGHWLSLFPIDGPL